MNSRKIAALVFCGLIASIFLMPKPISRQADFRHLIAELNKLNGTPTPERKKPVNDLNWYAHFRLAEAALQRADMESAYEEADTIMAIADARGCVLPPGPVVGWQVNDFDISMLHLALSFSCQPPECARSFSDPPLFESMFYEGRIKEERREHNACAEKLLRKAIQVEEASGNHMFATALLRNLSECLLAQDKTDESKDVIQTLEQTLEQQQYNVHPWQKLRTWEEQAELLEKQGRFAEAEQKLRAIVEETQKREDLSPSNLDKLLQENSKGEHSGIRGLLTCSALDHLSRFYQGRQRYEDERATLLRIRSLDRKIVPENCFVLTDLRKRLAVCAVSQSASQN